MEIQNLIIIPGHAIYTGQKKEDIYFSNKWIGTYQGYRFEDEVPLYVDHIRQGIIKANDDLLALLVFSGGLTRKKKLFKEEDVHPITEAQGSYNIAEQFEWFRCIHIKQRVELENYALDSYDNLLFSLCVFNKKYHKYPKNVFVYGLSFKKERYLFHADVIRRDLEIEPHFKFYYFGINNPPDYVMDCGSRLGEIETLELFKEDPHAEKPTLKTKKEERGSDWPDHKHQYVLPNYRKDKKRTTERK